MTYGRNISRYEQAYVASDFETIQARMRKRKLLEVLGQWKPSRILEIGCGADALFKHYRDFERFVVVEPGSRFAALAQETAGGDSRIRIVRALMEDAVSELAVESFDCIVLSGLLHEVPSCEPLLEAVAKVTKPHTRVHVNVPNARSLHRLLAIEMGLIQELHEISQLQLTLQQSRTFDAQSLASLCERCGFTVVESGSYFVKPFSHSQMAQLMTSR
ncbi:MAG TPA: methyltransferase domain-containing protein, partial [Burkholderiaceae bacterium]|nr:methyltransferase domain-containing protein [Burkholderiaceae bacterium]